LLGRLKLSWRQLIVLAKQKWQLAGDETHSLALCGRFYSPGDIG
jgi:hypothetical protein